MLNVPELAAFDPTSWQTSADWCRTQSKDATDKQQQLDAEASKIDANWPDPVGHMAASMLRQLALSFEELSTRYTDGGIIIDDAAVNMEPLRDQINQVIATAQGTPHLQGPDPQGFVESDFPFSIDKLIEWMQSKTYARQLTVNGRQTLMQADGRDKQATLALMAVVGTKLPATDDGPIDLSDEGIVFQADLNGQDRYGDCTTLSRLISIAHSDPSFVRRHLKWNPDTGRYEVTLYVEGKPVVVEVDPNNLPAEGSQQAATNKPSWLSIYEQAIEQQFGDIENGQFEDVPIARITGKDVPLGPPPSVNDIQDGMNQRPPAVITADTANATKQPDNVDPAKRVVHGHTYAVRGVDSQGNVILQNPWGPNGGWIDGKHYPGEVRLTPEEYKSWFSNGAVLNPPY